MLTQCVRTEDGTFIAVLEITKIVFKIDLGALGEGIPLWEDVDIKCNQDTKSGFVCPPSCFPGSVVTGLV